MSPSTLSRQFNQQTTIDYLIENNGQEYHNQLIYSMSDINRWIRTRSLNRLSYIFGTSLIQQIVLASPLPVVMMSLGNGADPNRFDSTTNDQGGVLYYACKRVEIEIIRAVLNFGAGIKSRNRSGETCLLYAVRKRLLPVIDLLCEYHACRY